MVYGIDAGQEITAGYGTQCSRQARTVTTTFPAEEWHQTLIIVPHWCVAVDTYTIHIRDIHFDYMEPSPLERNQADGTSLSAFCLKAIVAFYK